MRRIGLVLGAGGVAGQAFHAGVLATLAEVTGWDAREAEVVVGTSAGSITATTLRAGVSPGALTTGGYRRAAAASGSVAPDPGDDGPGLAPLASRAGRGVRPRLVTRAAGAIPAGRVSPGGIVRMVRHVAGERWPGEATWVCAVRRRDGRRFVFGHDGVPRPPLPLAVAASCAIPGYYTPVLIDGEEYVDGGAHSPTNLDVVAGLGLDLVVVSAPMSTAEVVPRRLDLAPRLLSRAVLARETLGVRRRGTPVLALQPGAADLEAMGLNALDPRRWDDVVRTARESTRRRLDDPAVRRLLAG